MEYARNHANLKEQLYAVLYNFLFKQKIEKIKMISISQYCQDPLENGVVEKVLESKELLHESSFNIASEDKSQTPGEEFKQNLISTDDVFAGYMDETAAEKMVHKQNSMDNSLHRNLTYTSHALDNMKCV